MIITCFVPSGFEGDIVYVEVDIRRGIPGVDIVGLPDEAVKEARDRVRVSITNSNFRFPRDRILINLSPADVRKEGACFDLPIALAILSAAGLIENQVNGVFLVIGELRLSGAVRRVRGVLSAVAAGLDHSIKNFIVPKENLAEAKALKAGRVFGVSCLTEAVEILSGVDGRLRIESETQFNGELKSAVSLNGDGDFCEVKGHRHLKRSLVAAAAGRHHSLIFGPPGSGKTMAAQRFRAILPDLTNEESLAVTRIHSLAGILPDRIGLIQHPPLRTPHHTASGEGLIGGGKGARPGEVSLAHHGVLFLDEAPEFRKNLLHSLREPLESFRVEIARAGCSAWYPADFQLILTANPCPCGNKGRAGSVCVCSRLEIQNYWKKIGGAFLDRIDIRMPVKPVSTADILKEDAMSSREMKAMVEQAVERQMNRYLDTDFHRNGRIPPGMLLKFCPLSKGLKKDFSEAVQSLSLSSRACHSILRVARTLADISTSNSIEKEHLFSAIQMRRYGDEDFFW